MWWHCNSTIQYQEHIVNSWHKLFLSLSLSPSLLSPACFSGLPQPWSGRLWGVDGSVCVLPVPPAPGTAVTNDGVLQWSHLVWHLWYGGLSDGDAGVLSRPLHSKDHLLLILWLVCSQFAHTLTLIVISCLLAHSFIHSLTHLFLSLSPSFSFPHLVCHIVKENTMDHISSRTSPRSERNAL